jgi:uncharacterized membrane-anchored protein
MFGLISGIPDLGVDMAGSRLYAFVLVATVFSTVAVAQEPQVGEGSNPVADLDWQFGPGTFAVDSRATITLPDGFDYLDAADTARLMELMENPTSGREYFAGPEDMHWFAVFEYDDTGHIEDDDTIDPEALLDALMEGNKIANEERRQRGWTEFQILGWQYEPFYDQETNRLTWAILGESSGQSVVNYNTRLLGRTGVMSATLVAGEETLGTDVEEFKAMLTGFQYNQGQRYAEYQPGDRLATYGLAALVTGGAAAAMVKSGAGKGLFKLIAAGAVAVAVFFRGIFQKFFGRK